MISAYHARAWSRIPEVAIVALGDIDIDRARFLPEARSYSDLPSLLASEDLDFIDILTPPEHHPKHCRLAAQAGVKVICQKPLALTFEQAREVSADVFAVHENHRYRPWFQRVKSMVGPVTFASFTHLNATEPAESYKNEAAQGVYLEYGSHLVDIMRVVLGEPSGVYARMHRLNPRVQGESFAHAVYEFDGATAVVEVGWKPGALTQGSVLLTGPEGEVWYEGTLSRGGVGRLRVSRGDKVVLDEAIDPTAEYIESFYLLQREFVDALLGRAALLQTPVEHLKTLSWTFAAYKHSNSIDL